MSRPPVFAVRFGKEVTLLVQARDREQLNAAIKQTLLDSDLDNWSTDDWTGELLFEQVNKAPDHGIAAGMIVHIDDAEAIVMPDPPEQSEMTEVPT